MDITIRREEPGDHRVVEEITRDAFWNLYVPGANEHYLVHTLRQAAGFVPELDFVAEVDGEVVGNIVYCRARIVDDAGVEHEVVTFGPVSVAPERQREGIGSALIRHSLDAARAMGFRAVLIFGDPAYYRRFGFVNAKDFGVANPEGTFMRAHMALPLFPGALDGVRGRCFEDEAYNVPDGAWDEFDRSFPAREKGFVESQRWFAAMLRDFL